MRTVRSHSRYVPEATRKEGMRDLDTPNPHRAPAAHLPTSVPSACRRRSVRVAVPRYPFGVNVSVNVFQVPTRRSPSHAADFAVCIRA